AGFDDPNALLVAPETRSSSPVRICRDSSLQAYFASAGEFESTNTGLYPCGEGPGFAGGIMSAAVDGLRVAKEVAGRYYCRPMVEALRKGNAVVLPTDTVYGLGISPYHAATPDVLYQIKQREKGKPIAWLVGNKGALEQFGNDVPEYAKNLAKAFWPGALTLIVAADPSVPRSFRSDAGTIGLRMPNNTTALEVIARLDNPIATSSANISGEEPTKSFAEIEPALLTQVEAWINDNEQKSGIASTVVDCTGDAPVILREGALTRDQILSVCQES
ncbi:MAG: L-threonylcarbamoyladenylate synthase, partial [Anaerotardibacter sp.]